MLLTIFEKNIVLFRVKEKENIDLSKAIIDLPKDIIKIKEKNKNNTNDKE
jgi:hypothetical protein